MSDAYIRLGFKPIMADVPLLWFHHGREREFDLGDRGGSPAVAANMIRNGIEPGPAWKPHLDTVRYWQQQFTPYAGREHEMPREWGVALDNLGRLRDGYHRLAAAKLAGLTQLPAWRP